jgi:hypothetical protein
MNRAASQRRADGSGGTRRLFGCRLLFFRDRRAFGGRRQYRRRGLEHRRDAGGLGRDIVAFIAVFFVPLAGGFVGVGIVHVVRDVLSVVLTELDGYVFID